jgi:signal transduction histidine kinase
LNQPSVLIISDDPNFSGDLVGRWQMERALPAFTMTTSDLWKSQRSGAVNLAIVGPINRVQAGPILRALDHSGSPVICVVDSENEKQSLKAEIPRVIGFQRHEGWLDFLILLAQECLRRNEAAQRAERAMASVQSHACQAALGSYMQQSRHSFNNALTSVLGNAELLILDPQPLSETVREQIYTIHSMALRLHEMMQRFTSLETEMQFAERDAQRSANGNGAAAGHKELEVETHDAEHKGNALKHQLFAAGS